MWFFGVLMTVLSMAHAHTDDIIFKKLESSDAIREEYCRTATGDVSKDCGMNFGEPRLDVIYLPRFLAQKIADHLVKAYDSKYYFNLDKKDLFHGHLLARGPQTIYKTAQEYFADVQLILYHSQEYLQSWEEILENNPFVPRENHRSFVGWFDEHSQVRPAIDMIDRGLYPPPYQLKDLRTYKMAGTIYLSELNESLKVSHHDYGYSKRVDLYLQSDDTDKKKCEIFSQIYILEQADGRFTSPDGKKFDIAMHCRYRRS